MAVESNGATLPPSAESSGKPKDPNPTEGLFTIDVRAGRAGTLSVEVVTILGQVIHNSESLQFSGNYSAQVNLADRPPGVYMIKVRYNDQIRTKHLVLTN